jgi:hypothetical protein
MVPLERFEALLRRILAIRQTVEAFAVDRDRESSLGNTEARRHGENAKGRLKNAE